MWYNKGYEKTHFYSTEDEHHQVQKGLRSSDAFVLRRGLILLVSSRGEWAPAIAHHLGCDDQTVCNVIKDFNAIGLAVLQEGSLCPHHLCTTSSLPVSWEPDPL